MSHGKQAGFHRHGDVVIGSGTAATHFYGAPGAGYDIVINSGVSLFSLAAIARGSAPSELPSAPDGELISLDHGSISNDGTLNVYPASTDPPGSGGCTDCLTPGVVDLTGPAGSRSSVVNAGLIGDRVPGSLTGGMTSEHGPGQIDEFGVAMASGTIENEASGTITGYNAIVTRGSGPSDVLNNYGVIDATNSGVISGFLIVNHPGGAISTGLAGFACVHASGDVVNYGYLLGQDFGALLQGTGTYLADYGGPPVPGIVNYDGSSVHDGEISAVFRSTRKINSKGPYQSGDAVMMDTQHSTLALHTTVSNGTVWLPVIHGPMVGGYQGDSASATTHRINTLAFDFRGLPARQVSALRTAVARSAVRSPDGTYFTGRVVLRHHVYHWVDWAAVTVDGTAVVPAARQRAASARSPAASAAAVPPPGDVAGSPWIDVTAVVLLFAVLTAIIVRGIWRRPRGAGPRVRPSHAVRPRPRD